MSVGINLVQHGKILRPLKHGRLSEVVALEYMGAAEFECGALPRSLRSMQEQSGQLTVVGFPDIRKKEEGGGHLLVYGPFKATPARDGQIVAKVWQEYAAALEGVVDGSTYTHEWVGLKEAMNPEMRYGAQWIMATQAERNAMAGRLPSFWWDIENNMMWSFDREFMDRLPHMLQRTWNYMDSQARQSEAAGR